MNRWLCLSIVLTLAAAAASLYLGWYAPECLPNRVPIHWNIHGEPDGFVPRDHILPYLLILPAVMALMVALTLILPWLSPKQFEVDRFRSTWNYLMAVVVALFAYIHAVSLAAGAGVGLDMNKVLVGGMFLFFALFGNVLGKVQRNFWMGVRTPWTLASETVWVRTHRLAAYLFVGGGLVGFAAVLAGVPLVACFVVILVAALTPVVYSLVLYKRLERQGRL